MEVEVRRRGGRRWTWESSKEEEGASRKSRVKCKCSRDEVEGREDGWDDETTRVKKKLSRWWPQGSQTRTSGQCGSSGQTAVVCGLRFVVCGFGGCLNRVRGKEVRKCTVQLNGRAEVSLSRGPVVRSGLLLVQAYRSTLVEAGKALR